MRRLRIGRSPFGHDSNMVLKQSLVLLLLSQHRVPKHLGVWCLTMWTEVIFLLAFCHLVQTSSTVDVLVDVVGM